MMMDVADNRFFAKTATWSASSRLYSESKTATWLLTTANRMPQSGKMDDSLFGYGFRYTHEARRAHPAANVIPMDALPTQSGARYLSPYLTCLGCDTVAMVNSATIQRALGFIPRGGAIPIEVLPKCSTCGKTSEWRVGAHDFSKEMDCSREDRLLLEKLKVKMAVQIQRMFRGYQGRKFARGEAERERKKKAKQDKSATLIQTQYRLYDAKRIAGVERALEIIKLSHPTLVIQRACQRWKELDGLESGLSHCFWYKTRQQLKLVFLDYRLLVSRSGYQPPQYVVEANIEELARRCKWLRNMFATRVQALQRGGAARLFFSIYRRERVWLREVRCRTAYRVQAVFRGWWGRRLMLRQKRKRWKEGHLGTYKGERKDRAKKERQVTVDSKLQAEYRKSKTEEMTARMVGRWRTRRARSPAPRTRTPRWSCSPTPACWRRRRRQTSPTRRRASRTPSACTCGGARSSTRT
jgi:hypothetical protein